jgi:hypothetical protein
MQKISSYLYPNRIKCNLDLALSPLEWRIVYQKNVKLYKGLDNAVELDIRNNSQQRIDITDLTLNFKILDIHGQEVFDGEVVPDGTLTGIARVEIPADTFDVVEPQFLKYIVYQTVDDKIYPVYGDTQFGASGTIDLIGNAWPTSLPPITIKTFLFMDDDSQPAPWPRNFYSEGAQIKDPNYIAETTTINVDFYPVALNTTVHVQTTDAKVISGSTVWTDMDSFSVTNVDSLLTKTYVRGISYDNDAIWLRVKYQLPYNSTGKFDKIIVRR